ncbi:MAG: GTPase [Bacilli bacterium]
MSEIKRVLRCYKCGVILQDTDASKPGYIISEVYNNHKSEILLCNNCFEKVVFNKTPKRLELDEGFYTILNDARASDALIVLVLDLFSFEGLTTERFAAAIEGCNVLVVGNKRDLLPNDIDDELLKTYVAHRLRVANINVKDIILTSSKQGYNMDEFIQKVHELRQRHDVYITGFSNSGKTSLSNAFLRSYSNNTTRFITTVNYQGTDLKVVEIPLDRTSTLYDLPGFLANTSALFALVEKNLLSTILPSTTVEGKELIMGKQSSIALGGLARFDLIKGEKTSVKVFISQKIEIKPFKLTDEIDSVFYNYINKKYFKPVSKMLDGPEKFDIYDVVITEEGQRDIGILGLGWISFVGKNQTFRVTVPKGVFLYTTRAKINYVKK